MIPQELMARHIIERMAITGAAVSPAVMLRIAKVSGQPMQVFDAAVIQLHQIGAIKPNTAKDKVMLSTKGERMADSFRGLSAHQINLFEMDAAVRILQGVAFGEHPGNIRPTHIGPARHNGIVSSLTEHAYVEQLHLGRTYRLTQLGQAVMQKCSYAG